MFNATLSINEHNICASMADKLEREDSTSLYTLTIIIVDKLIIVIIIVATFILFISPLLRVFTE